MFEHPRFIGEKQNLGRSLSLDDRGRGKRLGETPVVWWLAVKGNEDIQFKHTPVWVNTQSFFCSCRQSLTRPKSTQLSEPLASTCTSNTRIQIQSLLINHHFFNIKTCRHLTHCTVLMTCVTSEDMSYCFDAICYWG